ncbi:polysaccharide ABC transporter ATP-binding protein [Pedobacter aquatilis]|uniref:ABC transporter ATP-binding protein n=1 Tax=Pedobacter aquatilis TaxID=351343 RepID=UPI0029314E95|nr:polysaccharide ABC transporter ATP-binding protein [Pedobacter aquatilis]
MSKNIAIKVENLSKAYQLGQIGTGTISSDLERWYARIRGKEDPFLTIGETNDRTLKGSSDVVWSLKDINFEINQGDAVGIIGQNGAGKSTLLKILSKVTAPTTGKISGKGRIASLLEVGTGFHPELSGRENIFLNGAILGMRKKEIQRKLDEIVDFAGVERYIDTPVKRYSSGMYVRLAFGVAAHLESEILIIDEVLAVGDAEFQKKCLGKMNDVSKGEGRTVLFVSHNMSSISALCDNCIYLKNGLIENIGETREIIGNYISKNENISITEEWVGKAGDDAIEINKCIVYSLDQINNLHTNSDVYIEIQGEILKPIFGLVLGFTLWSEFDYELAYVLHDDDENDVEVKEHQAQKFIKKFCIPANTLAEGRYRIQFDVGIHMKKRIIYDECDISFNLLNISGIGRKYVIPSGKGRTSLIRTKWAI